MLQAHPGAVPHPFKHAVVPERHLHAGHGHILEDDDVHDGQQQHGVQVPVVDKALGKAPLGRGACLTPDALCF